jgi:alpha-galactosidase
MNYLKASIGILFLHLLLPANAQSNEASIKASNTKLIIISTEHTQLTLYAAEDGRLYQIGYGRVGQNTTPPPRRPSREEEFLPQAGNGFISEPAIQSVHSDGNTSTNLLYVKHDSVTIDKNIILTRIELKDSYYPFYVTIWLNSYSKEDIIEQWQEIRNEENKPVTIYRFASSSPVLKAKDYWVTQFQGNYKREVNQIEEKLTPGIKIFDSKIGVRAHQMRIPSFFLSLNGPAQEESGEVYGGSLAWSGSFQLAFEIDWNNRLREICGINPYSSQYRLIPGKTFTTPSMLWTYSNAGKGQASRNLHRWARNYGIREGNKPRPVILNNWEATHFNFTEQSIVSLFDEAKDIGVDLFLLDDGWFGNKYPRNDDKAGLGDWNTNLTKLPHGLSFLTSEAKKRNLNFGIWMEPEMVNPKSELYEKHPNWVIDQANRDILYSRNQLVLDLCRPETKEFVWQVVDKTLGASKDMAYTKWDCNRFVNQPGSSYLQPEEQTQLLTDYNIALYEIMGRMVKKYPSVMSMACAGGSGRVDYGAMKYFHSFWPSDNTDPRARVFIQWGFSNFFPANTIAAHITRMGDRPLKFTINVALSGALGLDMDLHKTTPEERKALKNAIKLYKNTIRDVVAQGDLYRLESPYEKPRAAMDYVSPDQSHAIVFVYQLKDSLPDPIKPRGLNPQRSYRIHEINLPDGTSSQLVLNGKLIDGATLMREGLVPPCAKEYDSTIIELDAEPEIQQFK